MKEEKYYSIGKVAKLTGLSQSTLRFYDSSEIVVPEVRNEDNSYRYYNNEQVLELYMISYLRSLDVSLKTIKNVEGNQDLELSCQVLEDHIKNLRAELTERLKKLDAAQLVLSHMRKAVEYRLKYNVNAGEYYLSDISVEYFPERSCFVNRRIVEDYDSDNISTKSWMETIKLYQEKGYHKTGNFYTIYHTNPFEQFKLQDCDISFCVEISETEGEGIQSIGGFQAAIAIHFGSYSKMATSHVTLLKQLSRMGYVQDGQIIEELLLTQLDSVDDSMQMTKIIIPVRKKL